MPIVQDRRILSIGTSNAGRFEMWLGRVLGSKERQRRRKQRANSVAAEVLECRLLLTASTASSASEAAAESALVSTLDGVTVKPAKVNPKIASPTVNPSTEPSVPNAQLTAAEVQQILNRAQAASSTTDAIIVVVDPEGNILGVRVESGVSAPNEAVLSYMIDGAVAEARTGAFFTSGQGPGTTIAPLTSRTVEFISQSTITQREVEAMPTSSDPSIQGPGFVAPIGIGQHFPPGVNNTPNADLFDIEATNRDNDPDRFNINPSFVPPGQQLATPLSYGVESGLDPDDLSRGLGTLPGGIGIFRATGGSATGNTLVGGIGVFIPGPQGYASYEQGFVPGKPQSESQRMNTSLELEAEYMAFAAVGGSRGAGFSIGTINGIAPVANLDLPFGQINLGGITLPLYGPGVGKPAVQRLVAFGKTLGTQTPNSADDVPVAPGPVFYEAGTAAPFGWLVTPHASTADPALTAAVVNQIIQQGIEAASGVQSAIRVPLGATAKMAFAVTDTSGEVLGLYAMQGATYFSLGIAVAKARNVSYYNDPSLIQPEDQVVAAGVSFTNRTFRFLAEPRYPSGVDGSKPGPFSILNDPGQNPKNAENIGPPVPASDFQSVMGYDAFNPNTNFREPTSDDDGGLNANGVVFFPGSSAVYVNGQIVGGEGVSGDGVNQDDVISEVAVNGFGPPKTVTRADQVFFRGVRLPYANFSRNPFDV